MKAFLLILTLVLAVVGLDAHVVQLTQSQKDKAQQYSTECVKQSGVKPEVLVEAKKGHFTDEQLKKFVLCFFQKAGILSSDAKLNVDVALAKLPPGIEKESASKLLQECKNKPGKDAADTAMEILKCYYQNTKTHILLL